MSHPSVSSHSNLSIDVVVDVILLDSVEVTAWMRELEGFHIPDLSPTADGSCGGDPGAAAQAAERGWWTCGGHVRATGSSFLTVSVILVLSLVLHRYRQLP